MPSAIDPTVIGAGNVDKASVRLQLERARDEITTLQTLTSSIGTLPNEDAVINGDFSLWQYGTSSTSAGFVGPDCWSVAASGGTVTTSRQAFAVGTTLGINNPLYHVRQNVTGHSGSTDIATLAHLIEGVGSYAGQTITILGWAYRSSGTGNMAVEVVQNFGTGGSPSATITNIGTTTVTLTGSWAPFAVTVAVPSISGKTLGSNANDYLGINFWFSGGSSFNARNNSLGLQTLAGNLWGVHIRRGTWTTANINTYIPVDIGTQWRRAQRYCCTLNVAEQSPAAGLSINVYAFPVVMRTAPALTVVTAGTLTNCTISAEAALSPVSSYIQVNYSAGNGSIVGRTVRYTANLA